jgi:Tfp pilus assembly pilus retraction ATPase PilT
MSKALESLFSACEELEASDVHVMAGRKPCFRVRGALAPRSDDKVVVHTTCQKDTALFFRFCAK